jgi:7,8-dihydropterin-6-yl-methyl-4-(beta-D-ribofuranosyl)aminobenzene 5'-phosphate synthase
VPGVAVPRPEPGVAVDLIALEPVDELVVTTLVDIVFDALLDGDERTRRAAFRAGTAAAPQCDGGCAAVGLVAEHGFAALVTVRRADATTSLLL